MLWYLRSIENDTSHFEIGLHESTSILHLLVPTIPHGRVFSTQYKCYELDGPV